MRQDMGGVPVQSVGRLGPGGRRLRALVVVATVAMAALLLFAGQAAASSPAWKLSFTNADYFFSGTKYPGIYAVELENVGDGETTGEVTLEDVLPPGLSASGVQFFDTELGTSNGSDLHEYLCPTPLECKFPGLLEGFGVHGLKPGKKLVMLLRVSVPDGVEGQLTNVAKVSGGGPPATEGSVTNVASADPPFGILHFNSSVDDFSKANPYTQAGGHPFQYITEFNFATVADPGETYNSDLTVRDPKNVTSELPPGLLANPQGVPRCSLADYFTEECSRNEDTVGSMVVRLEGNPEGGLVEPVYNLQPAGSYPGQLGSTALNLPLVVITTGVRTASDYGVTATSVAPQVDVPTVRLNLWGVPADEAHDAMRGKGPCIERVHFVSPEELERLCEEEGAPGGPAEVPPTPFLTMPTECSGNPLEIGGLYDSWQVPGEYARAGVEIPPVDGCNNLSFPAMIEARPTTNLADAPSGLEFKLHIPQNLNPEGVSTPELKTAVVKLPQGLSLNPSSGDGLVGCGEAQVALHSEAPEACPDASKLGSVEVKTPLLIEPLDGFLYLATPYQNPSGSLLAGYIVVEGQGVRIKLPGSFETDPQSGQITAKFQENPQLPFEELKLEIFGGARGALRTPALCGSYETTSSLTPFSAPQSGPPATPSSTFETSAGPDGQESSCLYGEADLPNAPRFHAGTETTQAGIYSPFGLKLVREDGSQEVTGVETTLPEGLVGRLAGIPYCPEAAIAAAATKKGAEEQANPSCPAASEVGSVEVAAGAGPTPIDVAGHVYLAGPYKGAPLSVAIITPALAGPFDLGTVAVRAGLYVNPQTTQITAKSDPIPHILEGIPLDIRAVTLKLNRPSFTRNPTSCEELAFGGQATSLLGARAPLTQRFQVGGCNALSFKPKLALQLKGATGRTGHPALTAILKMPEGGANIASAQVTLPSSEIVDNAHIGDVCTATEFAAGNAPGERCKPTSIYGRARAWSPLLEAPLEGPVFLKTPGHKLPDLLAALNGQIDVALEGKVDSSPKGGLRNTFEVVPDAPVSKFVLEMKGGKKGLLENNQPICAHPEKATALFSAHNGAAVELNPRLKIRCHKHKKHRRHHHRGGRRRG